MVCVDINSLNMRCISDFTAFDQCRKNNGNKKDKWLIIYSKEMMSECQCVPR